MKSFILSLSLTTIFLLVESRPGGVSQVGFSIYRNVEEQRNVQRNPLIVTYSINHPQDGQYGARISDPTHHFDRHQSHQQQMDRFRQAQERQRQAGGQAMEGQFVNGPNIQNYPSHHYHQQQQMEPFHQQQLQQERQRQEPKKNENHQMMSDMMRHGPPTFSQIPEKRREFVATRAPESDKVVVIDSVKLPQPKKNNQNHPKSNVLDLNDILAEDHPVQYF